MNRTVKSGPLVVQRAMRMRGAVVGTEGVDVEVKGRWQSECVQGRRVVWVTLLLRTRFLCEFIPVRRRRRFFDCATAWPFARSPLSSLRPAASLRHRALCLRLLD